MSDQTKWGLTFTTDELKADLEVSGPLKLTFWARTKFDDPLAQSKVDELLETLGNLNMNDTSIPHFVNKRDVQWVVEVWPTANVFKKEYKIRVSLSASDFPHLFPVFRPSENTIVIDENHKAGLTFTRVTINTDAIWVDYPTEYVLSNLHI